MDKNFDYEDYYKLEEESTVYGDTLPVEFEPGRPAPMLRMRYQEQNFLPN